VKACGCSRAMTSACSTCMAAMRLPRFLPKEHPPVLQHLADGFRYAASHSAVRRVLAMMGAATLAGMPGLVLMPFFADDIFHRGSKGYGVLMSAMGLGAVVGTLVLARRTSAHGLSRVMVLSGLTTGLTYLAFAFSNWYYLSLAIMPALGRKLPSRMRPAWAAMVGFMFPDTSPASAAPGPAT